MSCCCACPSVIEAFEGASVPLDSQSAEANLLDRNIDVVLADVKEVVWYLSAVYAATTAPDRHHELSAETPSLIRNVSVSDQRRVVSFGPIGIHGPRLEDVAGSIEVLAAAPREANEGEEPDVLIEQYQD